MTKLISNVKTEQLMQMITGFDENASIKFSRITGKFYLLTGIYAKGLNTHSPYYYGSICSHEYTIEECVKSAYYKMQGGICKIESGGKVRACKFPILIREIEK